MIRTCSELFCFYKSIYLDLDNLALHLFVLSGQTARPVALPLRLVVFIMKVRTVPELVSLLRDKQQCQPALVDVLIIFISQIGSLPGYYHFVKHSVRERSRRSLDDHIETLLSEPRVS